MSEREEIAGALVDIGQHLLDLAARIAARGEDSPDPTP